MEVTREKLRQLKEKRKQISHSNFKEVLEENHKLKRPPNWEKKLERTKKQLEVEEEKLKTEDLGQDYQLKKSLDVRADELERWDRLKAAKNKGDPGFIDFEAATKRQYSRLVKQMKPNLEEHKTSKQKVGEKSLCLEKEGEKIPTTSMTLDSKEGVERMFEDIHKQIEVRSKRSRRRRFDDDADVDYINERNMKFNKKLERFYGNYTEEIKQNFERGTAL